MRVLFKKNKKLAFKAFTLAEVLITLTIIGVVAALTLPPLINNYKKTQYVVGLKKAYAELSQAFKLYMADEGVTDLSQTPLFTNGDYNYAEWEKVIYKYFKVTKLCHWDDNSCQITESYLDPTLGSGSSFNGNSDFYTVDGMAFGLGLETLADCKPTDVKGKCITVYLDTNGPKPPNQVGRDFFPAQMFVGSDGNVYISGTQDDWSHDGTCGSKGSSDVTGKTGWYYCAARIQDEGWEMNY